MINGRGIRIFSGNSNLKLATDICKELKLPLGRAHMGKFPDGECEIRILENVRGMDCFVIQPTSNPANEHLMELLLIIDALKRASANRITAVLPYYGYGRQDRKAQPRVPISSKLVANLIVTAGANRALTVDLHASQIQGFFDIPVDHIYTNPVFVRHLKKRRWKNVVIVSPDTGGVERARSLAKRLNFDLAIIDKRRISATEAEMFHIIGDVKGKTCLIVDDIVDTAGTLVKGCQALLEKGAKEVYAACAHGVLAGPAIERIEASPLKELVITDTIPLNGKKLNKIKVLSVAKLISEAIDRIHKEKTISALFV